MAPCRVEHMLHILFSLLRFYPSFTVLSLQLMLFFSFFFLCLLSNTWKLRTWSIWLTSTFLSTQESLWLTSCLTFILRMWSASYSATKISMRSISFFAILRLHTKVNSFYFIWGSAFFVTGSLLLISSLLK